MNMESFLVWAAQQGISGDSYALGRDADEKYCIYRLPAGDWAVFYSERGHQRNFRTFVDESSALDVLTQMLLSDPTSRVEFRSRHLLDEESG